MILKAIRQALSRGSGTSEMPSREHAVEYQGYTIVPMSCKGANGWTTEGNIEQESNGEVRSDHFIRAETHADLAQAISHSITKAKRIIDEQVAHRG